MVIECPSCGAPVDDRVPNCKYCNALVNPEPVVPAIVVGGSSSSATAAKVAKTGCAVGSVVAVIAVLALIVGVGGILWAVLSAGNEVAETLRQPTGVSDLTVPPPAGPSVPATTAQPKPPYARLVVSGPFTANLTLSITPEGCATASTTDLNMPFAEGPNVTKVKLLLLPNKPGPGQFTATTGPAAIIVERVEGGTTRKWQTGAGANGGIITRAANGSVKAVFGALQPVAETGATGQLNGVAETVCP